MGIAALIVGFVVESLTVWAGDECGQRLKRIERVAPAFEEAEFGLIYRARLALI